MSFINPTDNSILIIQKKSENVISITDANNTDNLYYTDDNGDTFENGKLVATTQLEPLENEQTYSAPSNAPNNWVYVARLKRGSTRFNQITYSTVLGVLLGFFSTVASVVIPLAAEVYSEVKGTKQKVVYNETIAQRKSGSMTTTRRQMRTYRNSNYTGVIGTRYDYTNPMD